MVKYVRSVILVAKLAVELVLLLALHVLKEIL
jgi:hypothetical protein